MLNAMRNFKNSWTIRISLILIMICFTFWRVPSFHESVGSQNYLFQSNSVNTDLKEFKFAFNQAILNRNIQLHKNFTSTPDSTEQLLIAQYVYKDLSQKTILNAASKALNLNISDAGIAFALSKKELFKDDTSHFNHANFNRYLSYFNVSQEDYFSYLKKELKRQHLLASTVQNLKIPNVFLKALSMYSTEKRRIEFAEVLPKPLNLIHNPTEADLKNWYSSHDQDFLHPESRNVEYFVLDLNNKETLEALKNMKTAHQNQNPSDPLKELNIQIQNAISDGATFLDLTKQFHFAKQHANVNKENILNFLVSIQPSAQKRFSDNLFSIEKTDLHTTFLLQTDNQSIWYVVDQIIPKHKKTFDEARNEILTAWKIDQQDKDLDAHVRQISESLKNGHSFQHIVKSEHLTQNFSANIERLKPITLHNLNLSEHEQKNLFSASLNSTVIFQNPKTKTKIIAQIKEITVGDATQISTLPEEYKNYFKLSFEQSLTNALVDYFNVRYPLKINSAIANQFLNPFGHPNE